MKTKTLLNMETLFRWLAHLSFTSIFIAGIFSSMLAAYMAGITFLFYIIGLAISIKLEERGNK